MIDTPDICLKRAAASRSLAEGAMLENERRKLLTSAAAWDGLAHTLLLRTRDIAARTARAA
jgi:hypothetical protein